VTDNVPASPRWAIAPYFLVPDVVTAANYYRDKLGFTYERFWGDPPAFCMVKRGGIIIMLSHIEGAGGARPNSLVDPDRSAWDAYVWVDDGVQVERRDDRAGHLRPALRVPRFRRRGLQRVSTLLRARHRGLRV
jgi:hypothetical protein